MPATAYACPLAWAQLALAGAALTQQPQSVMLGSLRRSKMTEPFDLNVVATWVQKVTAWSASAIGICPSCGLV
jgi:hypothetical protein